LKVLPVLQHCIISTFLYPQNPIFVINDKTIRLKARLKFCMAIFYVKKNVFLRNQILSKALNSSIKFKDTGYFSKIICDYLDRNENVRGFYDQFPDIEGFKQQISQKKKSFSIANRKVLKQSLIDQTKQLNLSALSLENISLLEKENTYTVTTGHQLNLFTGPLYFLYKIISAINLAKELKHNFPEDNFVPVYWMATEDHDFEEIRFFNFKGKKISWNKEVSGAVGRTSTEGLDKVFKELDSALGTSQNAERLRQLFKESYLNHDNLTDATRYLANELFGDHGLVIIDGDDPELKRLFIPYVKEELLNQTSFNEVSKTNASLGNSYPIQVNPREINLFYLEDNLRERIVLDKGLYKINQTEKFFSKEEILEQLRLTPEKFSPNVLMRPLYQEVILPNLCYIGGGGELAYWMQLKQYFNNVNIPFPILLLRNSVLLLTEKQRKKMAALNISEAEIFLQQNDLIKNKVKEISDLSLDFSDQQMDLQKMFDHLKILARKTDKSFTGAVLAQEKKQLNGLKNLEKRLLKAQKRKYKETVDRITLLQNELFPKGSLQERQMNFSDFYEFQGEGLIEILLDALEPLKLEFDLISP
jgi:bacillithiol biosynthesis cysteine-adding enzyme BshC